MDRIKPVTRAKALIPDDVILTRNVSLDTGYRVLDDATSSRCHKDYLDKSKIGSARNPEKISHNFIKCQKSLY